MAKPDVPRDNMQCPRPSYLSQDETEYKDFKGAENGPFMEVKKSALPDGAATEETASSIDAKIGEVQENPTANTVLARLKAIQGYVDGLEAALGEVQASPTAYTVLARLKDLADRLGEVAADPAANTVLARLKTLEGYLDGVEAALGTQADPEATGDGSLIAIVKRLRTILADAWDDANNAVRTVLTGSIETVNDSPVTGIKTVTATAAEIFAGASRKANRRKMIIKNEDASLRFRIGGSDVTQQNGFPVEPGATVEFQFDPNVAVAIYAISEGADLHVAVMEI